MSAEKNNKEFLEEYTADFWNTANLAAFDRYFHKGFVVHAADGDKSREEYRALCQAYFAAFPDLEISMDGVVSEGDMVAKIWTARSTHLGDFMGIPASGNALVVKGIEVFRLANGKIAELWVSMDTLGMMQQMGVIPQAA